MSPIKHVYGPADFPLIGKMSTFGGPADANVGPTEGLALLESIDLHNPRFAGLFLPSPNRARGLARNLNPAAFYLACRWDYSLLSKSTLRAAWFRVMSPNGKPPVYAQAVDFGPGDGSLVDGQPTQDTGRIADLSPGLAAALGLHTDQIVTVELLV